MEDKFGRSKKLANHDASSSYLCAILGKLHDNCVTKSRRRANCELIKDLAVNLVELTNCVISLKQLNEVLPRIQW